MKRRNKGKKTRLGKRETIRPLAPLPHEKRHRGRELWSDLLKGLLVIAFVLTIKLMVEQTTFGKQLELVSYNLLQSQLSAERLPVAVVDISDLEPEAFNIDGQTRIATPRDKLRQMIEAIADQHPKAIGVDIDLAPDENGYIHPSDPEFFQFCQALHELKGVPVFLGIKRTVTKAPAEWLGSGEYQNLAANILIPKDSTRMVGLIKIENKSEAGAPGDANKPSKSMSAALAEAYGQETSNSPQWLQPFHRLVIEKLHQAGFIELISEKQLMPGLTVEDFLIDFSPLESIEPLRTINPVVLSDGSQRERFQGKIVLLGNATLGKFTDSFVVPGREQPYPGVLLHACATYTLTKAPLYEVTWKGRLSLDLLFSVTILLVILLIRFYYEGKTPEKVAARRLQGGLTFLVVLAAIIGGVVFVRMTRMMWDDFMLAMAALVFHPSIEHYLEQIWKSIRRHSPAVFHRLFFEQDKEGGQ